jgi:putative ABC transport system permease protein
MNLIDSLNMAVTALVANKMRSCLTMLGIVIGNASVITMIGVGEGTQKLAIDELKDLGPNTLFVTPGSPKAQNIIDGGVPPSLVLSDADAIRRQVPTVAGVAPTLDTSSVVSYQSVTTNTTIEGTSAEFPKVRNFKVETGRFITELDLKQDNQIAVLGKAIAKELFEEVNPIGKQIRIKNIDFQVVGIMASKGSAAGSDTDKIIYTPITTLSKRIIGQKSPYGIQVSFINVVAKDSESIEAAEFQISNLLRIRHKLVGGNDFAIDNQKEALKTVTNITNGLTLLLAAIAGISLFVGGVGVMNIMLVSVTERTQEIGLRKAIGATQADILSQFTIEAVILSTAGGIVGILIGVGTFLPIGQITPLQPEVSLSAILLSVGVSSSIGLFFGVVPARQAAKLDPIDALRSV